MRASAVILCVLVAAGTGLGWATGGVRFVYQFDRLKRIDYPSKTDVLYEYGPADAPFNRAGRILSVADETGIEERFYGALGETTKIIRTVNLHAPGRSPVVFTTEQVFDSLGRMLRLVYPDGEALTYAYDAGGLLARAEGAAGATSTTYVSDLRYDVFGNRTHALFGNGVASDWTYDPLMARLSGIDTRLPGGEGIQNLRYAYDPGGNPVAIHSFLPAPGPGSDLPGPGRSRFAYDGVDRLVTAHGDTTLAPGKVNAYDAAFSYSDIHNLTTRRRVHTITTPGGSTVTPPQTNIDLAYAYDPAHPHRAIAVGDTDLSYDPSGNVISMTKPGGATRTLLWDDDNRLAEVSHAGSTLRAFYDADGNRVVKRGRHGETVFVNPYFQLRNADLATKHVFAGPMRVASSLVHFTPATAPSGGALGCASGPAGLCIAATHGGLGAATAAGSPVSLDLAHTASGGAAPPPPLSGSGGGAAAPPASPAAPARVYYFHADHLGSTNLLTTADGDLHEHLAYFPEGEVWIDRGPRAPVNDYRFSGKLFDPETGFYDYGQRYYDPVISLWLAPEPLLRHLDRAVGVDEDEGPNDNLEVLPTLLAGYSYANHRLVSFTDRDGQIPLALAIPGGVALLLYLGMNVETHDPKVPPEDVAVGILAAAMVTAVATRVAATTLLPVVSATANRVADRVKPTVDRVLGFFTSSAPRTVPASTRAATVVYRSVDAAGKVRYVGITNNLARRAAEHLASKGIHIEKLMGGLSRPDARAVEQTLIEIHGLSKTGGTLINGSSPIRDHA